MTKTATKTSAPDFKNMSPGELVDAYNTMAVVASVETVKSFETAADGIRKANALFQKINLPAAPAPEKNIEETDMAKKSTAKKSAKKAKSAPASKAVPSSNKTAAEFGARPGTVREKLLIALAASKGKAVSLSALLKACYGSQNSDNAGALKMSLRGAEATIASEKLPYKIEKSKTKDGELAFGLHSK